MNVTRNTTPSRVLCTVVPEPEFSDNADTFSIVYTEESTGHIVDRWNIVTTTIWKTSVWLGMYFHNYEPWTGVEE